MLKIFPHRLSDLGIEGDHAGLVRSVFRLFELENPSRIRDVGRTR